MPSDPTLWAMLWVNVRKKVTRKKVTKGGNWRCGSDRTRGDWKEGQGEDQSAPRNQIVEELDLLDGGDVLSIRYRCGIGGN